MAAYSECEDNIPFRKLASIQIIEDIQKHPNADSLLIAHIVNLGWNVIINVNENIKIGDKVVYIETDSMLPLDTKCLRPDVSERMKKYKHTDGTHRYRIKIISLRGLASQGLIVPLDMLDTINFSSKDVGEDVTDLLDIQKYDPPVFSFSGRKKESFSTFPFSLVKKTDEPRIQTNPSFLRRMLECESYEIRLKVDGTSSTFLIHPTTDKFVVCSRNFTVNPPKARIYDIEKYKTKQLPYRPHDYDEYYPDFTDESTGDVMRYEFCCYWYVAKKYNIEQKLRNFGKPIFLQGEIAGPFIQNNLMGLSSISLFIYNIGYQRGWIANEGRLHERPLPLYCSQSVLAGINNGTETISAINTIGPPLEMVPLISMGNVANDWVYRSPNPRDDIKLLVSATKGYYKGTKNHREGFVIRGFNKEGVMNVSFKVINEDYLLKHD